MSVDRNLKRKKTREKKRKERREKQDRLLRHEKIDTCGWNASRYYYLGEYRTAFKWAMKGLKLVPADRRSFDIALDAAQALEEESMGFTVLRHGWEHGLISDKQDLAMLGKLAFERKAYDLARETLKAALENRGATLRGLTKKAQKEAERYLEVCQGMERLSAAESAQTHDDDFQHSTSPVNTTMALNRSLSCPGANAPAGHGLRRSNCWPGSGDPGGPRTSGW